MEYGAVGAFACWSHIREHMHGVVTRRVAALC